MNDVCDCERSHNGLGMGGRVCDCQPSSETVERVAKAIFAREQFMHMDEGRVFDLVQWDELGDPEYPVEQERYRDLARAALAAMEAGHE